MRTYEATFISDPNLSEEQLDAFIQQMEGVVQEKGAKSVKIDRWGKRSLAYQVGKFREGYIVVMTIEGEGEAIDELERRFKVTDSVIRYLTIRIDPAMKRFKKLQAKRAAKQARRARTTARTTPVVPPVTGGENEVVPAPGN